MKIRSATFFVLSVLTIVLIAWVSARSQTTGDPAAPGLKILAPAPGAQIQVNYVAVKFEPSAQATAATTPTYQLRLDDRDPVRSTDTEYTFTGLMPGSHRIRVSAIDANETPIRGASAEVQFVVLRATQSAPTDEQTPDSRPQSDRMLRSSARKAAHLVAADWKRVQAAEPTPPAAEPAAASTRPAAATGPENLPQSGSAEPLLALLGSGIVIGGVISMLRTRPRRS